MNNWILISILGGFMGNVSNYLIRLILKDNEDSTAYSWFHEFFRMTFYGIIVLYTYQQIDFNKVQVGLPSLIGLGIFELLAVYVYMKMHSFSHLSVSSIVTRARLVWIPLIAFFVFKEHLSGVQYFGIVTLLFGLFLASSPKSLFIDSGTKYAFLFSVFVSFVNIFMKLTTGSANTPTIMVFMALPSVIFFPILIKNSRRRIIAFFKTKLHLKILVGLSDALNMFLLTKALSLGPASIVASIYQGMMIVSVLAGIYLLNEKENVAKKLTGSLIVIVGAILLTIK